MLFFIFDQIIEGHYQVESHRTSQTPKTSHSQHIQSMEAASANSTMIRSHKTPQDARTKMLSGPLNRPQLLKFTWWQSGVRNFCWLDDIKLNICGGMLRLEEWWWNKTMFCCKWDLSVIYNHSEHIPFRKAFWSSLFVACFVVSEIWGDMEMSTVMKQKVCLYEGDCNVPVYSR